MKKNQFKSMIKSTVRAVWKVAFKPIVKLLPETPLKKRLLRAGGKIERREWWPKPPKNIEKASPHMNAYLLSELKNLAQIEYALTPHKDFINQLSQHFFTVPVALENDSLGASYDLLLRHIKQLDYDVVFLAPWLKRGGADLGLLHHINAQHKKGYKVLLITTWNAESPWIDRLPQDVGHLDFAAFTDKLNQHKKVELLARVLLQTSAQSIHNINSELGWDLYKKYGTQLNAMNKRLFSSVFCEDEIEPNIYFGYAPKYLGETYRYLSGVFCDTEWYPQVQQKLTGLDDLIQTVYFPFLGNLNSYQAATNKAPILWASRIVKQKRPQLLYQFAKAMPEQEFHVYGESDRACREELKALQKLPNVKYFGKYDSFAHIVNQQPYAAFLYTSQYDGLPNVLIEAISNGLPVISYDVGGISELIHSDTLLADEDSFEDNLKKFKNILSNTTLLEDSWKHSRDILKTRHSWNSFINVLESVNGYFPELSRNEYQINYTHIRPLSKPDL